MKKWLIIALMMVSFLAFAGEKEEMYTQFDKMEYEYNWILNNVKIETQEQYEMYEVLEESYKNIIMIKAMFRQYEGQDEAFFTNPKAQYMFNNLVELHNKSLAGAEERFGVKVPEQEGDE